MERNLGGTKPVKSVARPKQEAKIPTLTEEELQKQARARWSPMSLNIWKGLLKGHCKSRQKAVLVSRAAALWPSGPLSMSSESELNKRNATEKCMKLDISKLQCELAHRGQPTDGNRQKLAGRLADCTLAEVPASPAQQMSSVSASSKSPEGPCSRLPAASSNVLDCSDSSAESEGADNVTAAPLGPQLFRLRSKSGRERILAQREALGDSLPFRPDSSAPFGSQDLIETMPMSAAETTPMGEGGVLHGENRWSWCTVERGSVDPYVLKYGYNLSASESVQAPQGEDAIPIVPMAMSFPPGEDATETLAMVDYF